MTRIAVVGDVHFGEDSRGLLRPHLLDPEHGIDALLLAGDLTRRGQPEEAQVLADELRDVPFPVVAVLGNHDWHCAAQDRVADILAGAGVTMLEGDAVTLRLEGVDVGVGGVKGFGGGFAGACATEFGEPEMKAFVATTRYAADRLRAALSTLCGVGVRIALLHYSPIEETLSGERPALWPFLGSYLLGEAIDAVGADAAFHGHAHAGAAQGVTSAGVDVYNVAQPAIGRPFLVFELGGEAEVVPAPVALAT
jgi:Icc-related predicted phosphoesterase